MNERDAEEQCAEMVDECYPAITIFGMEFSVSQILKECDPIAWRQVLLDWADSEGIEIE